MSEYVVSHVSPLTLMYASTQVPGKGRCLKKYNAQPVRYDLAGVGFYAFASVRSYRVKLPVLTIAQNRFLVARRGLANTSGIGRRAAVEGRLAQDVRHLHGIQH